MITQAVYLLLFRYVARTHELKPGVKDCQRSARFPAVRMGL